MKRTHKKQFRNCPHCSEPLHSRNFTAMLRKCKKCYKMVCIKCVLADLCIDCYVDVNYTKYYAPVFEGVIA